MVKKSKLINGVDDKIWTRFAGHCKAESLLMGEVISDLLDDYNKKNLRGK